MNSRTRVPTRMTTRMMLQIQSLQTFWNTTYNLSQKSTDITTTSCLPLLNQMRTVLILLSMEVMPTKTMLMRINIRQIPLQKQEPQILLENTQYNLKLNLVLYQRTGEILLSTNKSTEKNSTRKLSNTQMRTIIRLMLQQKLAPQISLELMMSNLPQEQLPFQRTGETLLSTNKSTEKNSTRKLLSTQMKTITRPMLQPKLQQLILQVHMMSNLTLK